MADLMWLIEPYFTYKIYIAHGISIVIIVILFILAYISVKDRPVLPGDEYPIDDWDNPERTWWPSYYEDSKNERNAETE